jgi:hypothetical protein
MDFINNKNSDFWNELTEAQQVEIKKGIEQLNKGSGDFLRRCAQEDVLMEVFISRLAEYKFKKLTEYLLEQWGFKVKKDVLSTLTRKIQQIQM